MPAMPADTRRGARVAAALSLLALTTLLAGGAAAERREQDCFCTGLWTCIARTGLPYSECDQTGMRVICCVRRPAPSDLPGPMTAPPSPSPASATNEVVVDEVLRTDADTHYRYSTGRPTGRQGAVTTTAQPAQPANIYRYTAITTPTSTPPAYTTTAFDEVEDEDTEEDDEDEEDEDTATPTGSSPFNTTPRPVTTTSRPSTRPSARPSPRPSPRPSARPSLRPSPRPGSRPFAVFVTPVPVQTQRAQEVEWDDGAPHSSWSEEEEVEISRVAGVALQQREPKKIDWTALSRQGKLAGRQSNAVPPAVAKGASMNATKDATKDAALAVPWSSWRECGRKGADSSRDDGVAEPSEWPWHAALLETASDRYVCGATLVGPSWLLTAAHCIVDYPDPSALKVRVGELDVRSDSESFTQERAVVQLVAHPAFDLASLRHDIAMVRLARPPRDHRNVGAVCLPPPVGSNQDDQDADAEDFPREGTVCVVTGWGRKDEVSPHSEVLKEVPVPVWAREPCQEALRTHLGPSFQLPKTALCAGAKGRDACDGDGGGPLVCRSAGRWYQTGIVSYGIGCGRNNSPGVYTKLSSYTAWVRGVVAGRQDAATAPPARPPTMQRGPVNRVPTANKPPANRPAQQGTRNAPGPSPRQLVHRVSGPAVSRVRVNHYTGPGPSSTTPSTTTASNPKSPTRSVVVLSDERDEAIDDSDESGEGSGKDAMDLDYTPASPPASTTATPSTTTQRSGRAMPQQPSPTRGTAGAHSAGVSYIRGSFGSSGWNYPQESHKAAATVAAAQSVAAAPAPPQPPKWNSPYSPSYSGSYRGTAVGARLPGQILSNVAGRTAGGLNRWYSPFYSGSYRGDYNASPKDAAKDAAKEEGSGDRDSAAPTTTATSPSTTMTTDAPKAAYKVRPPLAAPRWYAPLHEEAFQGRSWYTSFHNGTIRSGYASGLGGSGSKHRFAPDSGTQHEDEAADQDHTWTYHVKTGSKGTSITLDSSNSSQIADSKGSASATGLNGESSSYTPYVAEQGQGLGQGRTLVNFTNTFTYPSAPNRNASQARAAPRSAPAGLSSSYSIYRIYPSVYNTEYRANSAPRGRDPKALDSTSKVLESPAKGPAQVAAVAPSRNSIVGYSHFSTGNTAVNFNITHESAPAPAPAPEPAPAPAPALAQAQDRSTPPPPPPPVPVLVVEPAVEVLPEDVPVVTTALDLTTLRAATAEDMTGGEGMDVPPVSFGSFISTTEPDRSDTNAPTATLSFTNTPTESVTATSTEYTTRDVMTTTTEADAVALAPTRGRGRGRVRASASASAEDSESSAEAENSGPGLDASVRKASPGPNAVSTVSTLARRGGHQDSLFAPRRRPDTERGAEGLEATWGDKTSRRGRGPGSRGGRRLDNPGAPGPATEADVPTSNTPVPRSRSRSRARAQHQEQPEEAVSFVSRKSNAAAAPAASPRTVGKERVSPGPLRHSRPVDLADLPDTAFLQPVQAVQASAEADAAARAFRARARRPTNTAATTSTPLPPPPSTSTDQDGPEVMQFVAEVKPPRARGRGRKSEPRRRGPSAAVHQQAVQDLQAVEPELIFAPAAPAPRQHQQRTYSKKPRKQLKKVSLSSSELQEPLETAYAPAAPRHQHAWGPVAVEAPVDILPDASLEHRDDGVEDLERDDIYSFLSQRAKRRRGQGSPSHVPAAAPAIPAAGGLASLAGGAAAIAEAAEADPSSSPQGLPGLPAPRWGRKGAAARRRGQAVLDE